MDTKTLTNRTLTGRARKLSVEQQARAGAAEGAPTHEPRQVSGPKLTQPGAHHPSRLPGKFRFGTIEGHCRLLGRAPIRRVSGADLRATLQEPGHQLSSLRQSVQPFRAPLAYVLQRGGSLAKSRSSRTVLLELLRLPGPTSRPSLKATYEQPFRHIRPSRIRAEWPEVAFSAVL
jgi:hypothetical protein